jgi:hypothetical protein
VTPARARAPGRAAAAGAAALLAAAASAQTLTLHFRPDPQRAGPPALVWLREELPRLLAADVDPSAGLRLRLEGERVQAAPDDAAPGTLYLAGELTLPAGTFTIACDETGYEVWRGPRRVAEASPVLRDLLACTDAARPAGATTWVDVAVLVGLSGPGYEPESPLGVVSTLGASECGDLWLRATTAGDVLELHGRSRGGLTLPAVLLLLARRRAADPAAEEHRWIALAFAARDSRREEAALQLARFASADSERCLRALLHADPATRERAIESLARRGIGSALPSLVAAGGDQHTKAAAAAALATLWPGCSPEERQAARARLGRASPLHEAIDRAESLLHAPSPPVRPAGPDRPEPWRAPAAGVLALSVLLLLWRDRRARGTARQRIS